MTAKLVERVRSAAAMTRWGLTAGDRARIAAVVLLTPLRRRLPVGARAHRLRLAVDGEPMPWIASTDADLEVVEEIFGTGVYDLRGVPEPAVIADLGAHLGASITFFRRRFPAARIVGVEPDPVTFRRLVANVGHLPGVDLLNVAIADTDGPVRFFSSGERDSWASSTRASTPWQHEVEVAGRTLDGLLAELGIDRVDLLKIDVEGAEAEILRSFAGLAEVTTILGEVHPGLMGVSLAEFRALLDGFETDLPEAVPTSTAFRARRRDGSRGA